MSGSAFTPKILFAAFALFTSSPVLAQSVEVATKNFSLTFPAGWSKLSVGGQSDSASAIVMNMTLNASGFVLGVPHQGALTQEQIEATFGQFGDTDSLEKVGEGKKTLGGREFAYLEYKDKSADANPDERSRIYYVTQGSFLFEALLLYEVPDGAAAVTQMETALATLKIEAIAGLRAVAGSARSGLRPANLDILGRLNQVQPRRTPLFRVPAF
jgi:hypothetical protein